ncbi:MAG: hypothetical protein K2I73_02090 [Eubacterium sp.]|nr:hypothetical protein [Eubacterium sp.]
MEHYIKLGKRYKRLNALCAVIAGVAIVVVLLHSIKLWLKILLSLIILFISVNIIVFIGKQLRNILFEECNPEKFYCVSKVVYNGAVAFDMILAMEALGDFNRAADHFKAAFKTEKKSKKLMYGEHFAYIECLFSAGEYEACIKEITDFRMKVHSTEVSEKMNKHNLKVCDYFESFINKDYEKCILILDSFRIDELKYPEIVKCTMNYFYAISYYYGGNIEKAKEHFEKIKDINDSLYYTKKAREYLANINEDKFLELSFDDIPKYESNPIDLEAKKKADRKMYVKALISLLLLIVVMVGAYFLVSADEHRKGTAEEIISYSMDFDVDVKAILPIENEDAALCVFQDKDDFDYLYVAYLESYENDLYSYGIDYSFLAGEDGVQSFLDIYDNEDDFSAEDLAKALHKDEPFTDSFDRHDYYFGSGEKDITVVYRISRYKPQVPKVDNAKEFVYTMYNGKEKTYYIYVLNVEKENQFGYSAGEYSKTGR